MRHLPPSPRSHHMVTHQRHLQLLTQLRCHMLPHLLTSHILLVQQRIRHLHTLAILPRLLLQVILHKHTHLSLRPHLITHQVHFVSSFCVFSQFC